MTCRVIEVTSVQDSMCWPGFWTLGRSRRSERKAKGVVEFKRACSKPGRRQGRKGCNLRKEEYQKGRKRQKEILPSDGIQRGDSDVNQSGVTVLHGKNGP